MDVCTRMSLRAQAILHTQASQAEEKQKFPFGVAGVHYRFDAFVKLFRTATTLRDMLKFGA